MKLIVVAGWKTGLANEIPDPVYCGFDDSAAKSAAQEAQDGGKYQSIKAGYVVAWDRAIVKPSKPTAQPQPDQSPRKARKNQ